MINNKTYRGQLETESVTNAICAGFKDAPEVCFKYDFGTEPTQIITAKVIIAIVICLIGINVVIVYCYRRYARREM